MSEPTPDTNKNDQGKDGGKQGGKDPTAQALPKKLKSDLRTIVTKLAQGGAMATGADLAHEHDFAGKLTRFVELLQDNL